MNGSIPDTCRQAKQNSFCELFQHLTIPLDERKDLYLDSITGTIVGQYCSLGQNDFSLD